MTATWIRLLRRLCDAILCGLVAAVVLVGVASVLAPAVGRQLVIIRGASMQPQIPRGALAVVDVSRRDPRPGDIVTISEGNGVLVTHRVVDGAGEPGGSIRTKGDANSNADPTPVSAARVVGTVEASVPVLGYMLAFLEMPTGLLTCAEIVLFLLVAAWLLEDLEDDLPATFDAGHSQESDALESLARGA